MANSQPSSNVLIPLESSKKRSVTIGCILLLVSISMVMSGNVIFLRPVLTEMNQMGIFTLLVTVISMVQAIMNPIGGKLGDIIGKRKLVLITMSASVICMVICAFSRNTVIFVLARVLLSLFSGACTAVPYVIAREINTAEESPKFMGMLASGLSFGMLLGGFLTGFFVDRGLIWAPMIIYAIPTAIAAALICTAFPNKKSDNAGKLDIVGVIFMSITIVCLLMGINMVGKISQGTTSVGTIVILFAATIVSGVIFVKVENKAEYPIIPIHLLKNGKYVCMLLIGSIAYYYQAAVNVYAPIAVTDILVGNNTMAGSLQIPRTVVVLILSTFAGVWVGKKRSNIWKAIAIALVLTAIAMLPLSFLNSNTSVIFMIAMITITGIGESFRSVSITPGAQNMLAPQDMAIGTSLVTFMNTLITSVATAVNGLMFDSAGTNIQKGIQNIFLSTTAVTVVGVIITFCVIRKFFTDEKTVEDKA